MKKINIGIFMLFSSIMLFTSCGDKIDESIYDYTEEEYEIISQKLNLPSEIDNYFEEFPIIDPVNSSLPEFSIRRKNRRATLGRVLFYDTKLSINESVTCASCHKQELAFADDVAFSEGFNGELTTRNSLPLGNTVGFEMAYGGPTGSLFAWDEANEDIASQSKAAIISEIEMGLDMDELVNRVSNDEIYTILFQKAFNDDNDDMERRILIALEEFVNRIVSDKSRFDHELMNNQFNHFNDFNGFTQEENKGKDLYMQHCSQCHSETHRFTSIAVANNGLEMEYVDKGLGGRTLNPQDMGVFKIPFLRNIELTAPYMHDGRFETLREVIDHYSEGIVNHPNLNANLKVFGEPKRMNFTEEEKNSLESYLKTLTDNELIKDEKFSDPFKI